MDQDHWPGTAAVIYSLVGRGKEFEPERTIAVFHDCLCRCDDLDGNLVWSITKALKGVSYLSEYDPYKDEAVLAEMKKIEMGRDEKGP